MVLPVTSSFLALLKYMPYLKFVMEQFLTESSKAVVVISHDRKFVDNINIYAETNRIVFKSERTTTISRLLEGQFPQYNKLIPNESPKEAIVNVSQMISALDRVSVMVNEKTSIAKFEFNENNLTLSADTPDSGKSEENIDIDYTSEPLTIAFNYKYMLEALKNIDSDEVKIGLNTSLSATVLRPNSDEDFVCLVMPVQIR